MTLEHNAWTEAAALFDQLAPLPAVERERRIRGQTVPPAVRRWLDELLQAHDSDRSLLIDREVDALARALAPSGSLLAAGDYVGERFGPWQAEREIGRGGMGVVLLGHRADGQFEMRVAIKLLDPQRFSGAGREALQRELRLLAALEHPGIARLIDGGVRDDGLPYLVMEYVDGESLGEWAERCPPDPAMRVRVLIEASRAVAHCHAQLVVHGDIKPANVRVDRAGRVRLLDFGISSRLGEVADSAAPGWCSPGYAAPERLRGAAPAIAEDVFALGALLYSLLCGVGIRRAPEQTRILVDRDFEAIASPPPPSARLRADGDLQLARRVEGDLDAIVMQALAPEPAQRYATVEALIADLEAWLERRPVAARRGGAGYRLARWGARNRTLAAAVVVGTLALVGGSGVALWQAERATASAAAASDARSVAEQAAARADAVNRFLLELFRARIPDLPPEQLPTTRQLMDQGIERARDPASGPPGLRAELLISLAEILAARSQLDEAETLLDEAGGLIAEVTATEPRLRLRLAVAVADLARQRNRLDQAEQRLGEAIALYRELQPDDPLRLELQRDQVRILMRREQFEAAEQAGLALQQELAQWPGTDDLALRLAGDLAVIAGSTGRHAQAEQRFEQILEMKQAQGHTPVSLSTTEINLALLARLQHRYGDAIERYRAVLERLAPYTEVPRSTRATAFSGLSDIARMRGDFDAAEALLAQAAEEWARVLDLASPDDDFYIHHRGARIAAERGDHALALARLETAIERLRISEEAPPDRVPTLLAERAALLCRLGDPVAARRSLDQIVVAPSPPVQQAADAARAACALDGGAAASGVGFQIDPDLISAARIEHARQHGEDAVEIAGQELLRARMLHALGRSEDAAPLLAAAIERLDAAGVRQDHPLRDRILAAGRN